MPNRRTVLLTGASSGIGRAAAIEFARQGPVRLLLVARRRAELEQTAQLARTAGDAQVELLPCDLADPAQLDELVTTVTALVDRLDVLVNNAGVGSRVPFEDAAAMHDVDRMLALNLRAPIALVHGLAPLLVASRGAVVGVASVAGMLGTPGSPVYSATKWGLVGFDEALRARYADLGVRVSSIRPGPVPTPGWPHERLARRPLLGRLLASDAETIARDIVHAAGARRSRIIVRPRTFAPIPMLRALAPGLMHRLLRSGAGRGPTPASTDALDGRRTP